jgi:hypothetical protein
MIYFWWTNFTQTSFNYIKRMKMVTLHSFQFIQSTSKSLVDFFQKALFIAALLLISFHSDGQKTWTGAVSTNWFVAGNWSPSIVPKSTEDVIINNAANFASINSTSAVARSVYVSSGGVLKIQTLGVLSINGALTSGMNN